MREEAGGVDRRAPNFWLRAGLGVESGRKILRVLERHALGDGLTCVRVETGVRQPEAIEVYRSCGYSEIEPFGSYLPDRLSNFVEKRVRPLP